MQLSIDSTALGLLLGHAASAARIVGQLDAGVADGPLTDYIDAIVHGLSELLGDPRTLIAQDAGTSANCAAFDGTPRRVVLRREGRVMRRQLPPGEQTFDIAGAVNNLRQRIAKTEAFATTADDLFEEVGNDRRSHERLAWLVTETAIAAQAALAVCNKLAEEVVKHGVGT
jgi:hypothetical protein